MRVALTVQSMVPETERYQLPEAETALVYPIGDHGYHDLIMCMVHSTLEESWDDNANDWIIMQMRLNISPPEEYSGSSDLKVYEMFIAGILQWLRQHGLLGVNYTETQVHFLGTWLKGNTSEWFTRNVECPRRPIKDVGCIYAPDKVNPNIFHFNFNFSSIFYHTSMDLLLRNFYDFYLIFYHFILPVIIYQKPPLLEVALHFDSIWHWIC